MPRRQPFTRLCQLAATVSNPAVADLHLHTTASDGTYTPSQVVAFAQQAGLKALAITDHDTVAGWTEAEAAMRENRFAIELVTGIEISTFHDSRDWHLLAYDFRETNDIRSMIAALQAARRERFLQFVELLKGQGHSLPPFELDALLNGSVSLGRRHLASLIVQGGFARSRYEAFRGLLIPLSHRVERLRTVSLSDAISIVNEASGFTSLAHPPADTSFETLIQFRELGLDAIEASFPAATRARSLQLREWAIRLNLGTTGGSDSHGDDRRIGSETIPMHDLERLRGLADSSARAGRGEGAFSAQPRD